MAKKVDQTPVVAALADLEENDRLLAELRSKTWKRSELRRLLAHISDSNGRYGPRAIEAFAQAMQEAAASGRIVEDEARTFANLDAQKGGWIIGRGEVFQSSALAERLEESPPESSSLAAQAADQWAIGWPRAGSIVRGFVRARSADGCMALEGPGAFSGLVFERATLRYPWLKAGAQGIVETRAEEPGDVELAEAQIERAQAMETLYALLCERWRLRKLEAPTALPMAARPEELLAPFTYWRGARWYGFASRPEMREGLSAYVGASREALRQLRPLWQKTRAEALMAYQEAASAAGAELLKAQGGPR